jgi:hypothetical protein
MAVYITSVYISWILLVIRIFLEYIYLQINVSELYEASMLLTVCALVCLQDMTTFRLSWYHQTIQYNTANVHITSHWGTFVHHCCSGNAISIIYRVCVCVCICSRRYPACNAHAPYCHLWPIWLYHIFPYFLINGTICMFWFYLQICLKHFSF